MSTLNRRDVLKLAAGGTASVCLPRVTIAAGADYDVVIIGAGIAGMTAARLLSKAGPGLKVLVLEARSRVGGRLMTLQREEEYLPAEGVELGASLIHGSEAGTWDLVNEFQFTTRPLPPRSAEARDAVMARLATAWDNRSSGDLSYAAFLDTLALNPEDREIALSATPFDWADPTAISASAVVRDSGLWHTWHDQDFQLLAGHSALAARLSHEIEGRIQLNSVVDEIFWRPGLVGVSYTLNGSSTALTCRQLVITVPLGVLQSNTLKIDPPLPPDMAAALKGLAMSEEVVVPMVFSQPFTALAGWRDNNGFSLFDTPLGPSTGVLGHFTGTAAGELTGLAQEAATARVLRWLEEASGQAGLGGKLAWHKVKDWSRDPFSQGGRSFARPGAAALRASLSLPVEGTLYVAGEATALVPHYATVHGAYMSGVRVADQVANALNVGTPSDADGEESLFQLL
ncbi:MAG: NAD(P)/FAD-dependent oxidoreductase [Halieaceae bacterium]|jgi:monoamine oxidase|nr:NAD(P)/FAD-dependent oxidoreductase [Halieaceae bacterium]